MNMVVRGVRTLAAVLLLCGAFASARADDIAVANYGVAMNGMPFVIAVQRAISRRKARRTSPV